MKLHRLTIRNLSALRGEHTIEFDAMLGGAGMFLIHGPTGAGKTTILDAICLALYGKTPRLTSTAHGNDTSDAAGVKDGAAEESAARMLSHGEHEAMVELEFALADALGADQRYRAGWFIHRAKKKADGKFQKPIRKLERLEGETWKCAVESHQPSQYGPVFDEALHHLSFEDFQRTVLLAQFAFREFLDADEKQRTALLERLTGSSRFREIGKAAAAERQRAERAVETLTSQLARVALLAPEARADLEATFTLATGELREARTALENLQRAREYWRALAAAERNLAEARQEATRVAEDRRTTLAALEALAADERVRPARTAYEGWSAKLTFIISQQTQHDEAASAVRDASTAHTESVTLVATAQVGRELAEAEISTLAPELERAVAAWHHVQAAESEAKATVELLGRAEVAEGHAETAAEEARKRETALADELRTVEVALEGIPAHTVLRDTAPLVAELGQQVEKGTVALGKADDERRALAGKRDRHAAERPNLATIEANAHATEAAALSAEDAARRALGEATQGLSVAEAREKLLAAKEAADGARRDVEALTGRLRELTLRKTAARDAERALAEHRAAVENAIATRRELTARLATLEAEVPDLEASQRRLAGRRTLIEHRSALEAEHACPVCGSDDHPYRVRPETAPSAEETLRELEACETALSTLRARAKGAATELAESERRASKAEALRDATEKEHGKAEDAVRDASAECAKLTERLGVPADVVELDLATRARNLDSEAARIRSEGQRLEHLVTLERNAAEDARLASQAAVIARAVLERHDAETQGLDAQLMISVNHTSELSNSLETSRSELRANLARLGLDGHEPSAGVTETRVRAERLRACCSERDRLVPALEALTRTRIDTAAAAANARLRVAELRADRDTRAAVAHHKRDLARGLLGGERPESVRARLDEKLRRAVAAERAAEQHLHAATTALERSRTLLAERDTKLAAVREAAATARSRLDEACQLVGVSSDEELLRLCLDEATRTTTMRLRDELLEREHAARGRLGAAEEQHLRQLGERPEGEPADTPSAERLPQLEQAVLAWEARRVAAEERASEANVALRRDDDAKRSQAADQAELKRLEADRDAWEQLHQVIGVRDGDAFAKVVQTLHLGHVVEHANLQLARFLPRYQLEQVEHVERGPTLDFRVVDHDQQGAKRSIHGLSGGESFIVSLALALGLAESRGSRLRLDTLLIDEGFGSLDEATLGQVLVALEALQSTLGVTIGLISHVELMKAMVPAQIEVKPTGAGRSTLLVPGLRK
ncbi:MAG: AAA family ATPase [Deltaproteobacteria bacterium]|nr:AAA family ATPase [Deltaproteobacteria bacterium]